MGNTTFSKRLAVALLALVAAVCFALGAGFALGRAPAARAEALSVASVEIAEAENHIEQAAFPSAYLLTMFFKDVSGTSLAIDKSAEIGDFAAKITVNDKSATEFGLANAGEGKSGLFEQKTADGATTITIGFLKKGWSTYGDWATFLESNGEPLTLKIPAQTTFYNFTFESDILLYFYEGKWHKELPAPLVTTEAASLALGNGAGQNHGLVGTDSRRLLVYAWPAGSTSGIKLDYRFEEGDFFSKILLDGEPTDKFSFRKTGGHSADGASPIDFAYAEDETFWGVDARNYRTLTVPAGTTFYNIVFANEISLYFYSGEWHAAAPAAAATADGYAINVNNNHLVSGDEYYFILVLKNGENEVGISTSFPEEGNFGTNATLNEEALSEYGFGLSSKTADNSTLIYFSYDKAKWDAAAAEGMITLKIPEGTTLKNITFAAELTLYFYNGMWMNAPMQASPASYQQATGISVHPTVNHGNTVGGKGLIFYAVGANGNLTSDRTYPLGNFFDALEWDGGDNPGFALNFRGGNMVSNLEFAKQGTLLDMVYTETASFAAASPAYRTLTVPQGTKLYDIEFAEEVKLYFYDGKWNLETPYDPETDLFSNPVSLLIEPGVNHVNNGGKMTLVFYAEQAPGKNIALQTKYPAGDFFEKITLNGEPTEKFSLRLNYHGGNGKTPIDIVYDPDDVFWAATEDAFHTLKIPAGAKLYNIEFTEEFNFYFFGGKWQLQKPVPVGEREYIDINGYAINYLYNHALTGTRRDLILHLYRNSESEDKVAVAFDQAYPKGDFETKIGFYDSEGKRIESTGLAVGWDKGHMTPGSSAVHLYYDDNAELWVKTVKDFVELRIDMGAELFNLKMNKEFSLYFFNGKWQTNRPITDYEIDEENLDHFTIGELVEVKPAKKSTFLMGQDGDPGVVAGTLTSPLLNSKAYVLEFDMKITTDTYYFTFALNGSGGNLWQAINLLFINKSETLRGVSYLDYINPEGHLPDYLINDYWFEKDVKYNVKILVATDVEDRGALLRLTVDDIVWGELFIPVNEGYQMSELMGNGFVLCVNDGTGAYFGAAEFTNIDTNPPAITLNGDAVIESGATAEGFAYPVTVSDGIDGIVEYTAEIISGALSAEGKFVENTSYVVRFTARDAAGNTGTKEITFLCKYDVTPPEITFGENVTDGAVNAAVGISQEELLALIGAAATDNKSSNVTLTYSFPEGMFAEGKLLEGRFRVEFTAKDESGNETVLRVRVIATEQTAPPEKGGCGGCGSIGFGGFGGLGLLLFAGLCAVGVRKRKA